MQRSETRTVVRKIVVAGVLAAITIVLGGLGPNGPGYILVPTPANYATTLHVPVIIGAVLEGPLVGLLLGLIFGISSWFWAGPLGQVAFQDPVVAILPRLFIGITAWAAYAGFRRTGKYAAMILAGCLVATSGAFVYMVATQLNLLLASVLALVLSALIAGFVFLALRQNRELQALILAAAVGTLTNTVLVLTLLVLRGYMPPEAALVTGLTNGVFEVIIACIIVVAVVGAWKGIEGRRAGSTV
jgi:uncharacterized membrane protein